MIQFTQVSKAFGKQQVINNASFTVHQGERVGFVGPNGAGKSTLFEMLSGGLSPDKGSIDYPSTERLGYVKQQIFLENQEVPLLDYVENAIPELETLQEEIHRLEHSLDTLKDAEQARALTRLGDLQTEFEHLGGYELKSRAEMTLTGLGFRIARFNEPFSAFSGGWKIRAELARVLVSRPDILLLDEPTNYLDVPAIEWLKDFLRNFSGTLLLVSHDRYLLNSLTNVTIEVMGGMITRYPGNYDQYVRARETRHEQLLAQKKNLDRKREQIETFIDRFKYKATKAAQAQSRQKMLDKLEDVEIPQIYVKAPKIRLPIPPRSGQDVVSLQDASFGYTPDNLLFEHVNLTIERGEKAAFVGLNGLGKTTLFRIFCDKLHLTSGKCTIGHGVEIGYQSQDFTETMDPSKTVFETVRAVSAERSEGELRNMLGGFGFPGEAIDKYVSVLSGGEKVRLALARLLLRPNNFLLLDEPTTHLDIYAREALEDALKDYQGTLCLVSHDITFVRNLATTIFELTPGKITRFYGNYDYYRQKLAEQEARQAEIESPTAQKQNTAKNAPSSAKSPDDSAPTISRKDRKREEANIRNQFSAEKRKYEKAVEAAEKKSEMLEAEQAQIFSDMANAKPGLDFAALNKRLAEIKKELEDAVWEWDEASRNLEDVNKRCEARIAALK
ncbi:MAG: ATP-binding cassette domain-containing protein [Victivallales bacterium]|nr:ATP-binding cassette domain-containing protein [Victivallales bacterium]